MILQPYNDDNDDGEALKSLFFSVNQLRLKRADSVSENMIRLIIHIFTANDIVLKFEQYY